MERVVVCNEKGGVVLPKGDAGSDCFTEPPDIFVDTLQPSGRFYD